MVRYLIKTKYIGFGKQVRYVCNLDKVSLRTNRFSNGG